LTVTGGTDAVLEVAGHAGGPAPRGLRIPLAELSWRFSGSGGPGGQHVNTANTRAEVVFDIAGSPSVPEAARDLLVERLGPSVAVAASDRRSQIRNRELALERLAARLAGALVVERPRRPTRPSRASVRRRLDAKRRQGERKADRRSPRDDG
jgi:ribosome-associated protein